MTSNNSHPSPAQAAMPTSEAKPDDVEQEKRWIDAWVRWDNQAENANDENCDENDAGRNLFGDDDPLDNFSFNFRHPIHPDNPEMDIHIELQGYKPDADEIWNSTGLTLWRASQYLCDYLVENYSEILQNKKRILELGAGLGLCGILAHRLTSSQGTKGKDDSNQSDTVVYLTDGDTDALAHLRENVERNCNQHTSSLAPEATTVTSGDATISCRQLLWGRQTSLEFLKRHCQMNTGKDASVCTEKFDVLLASDVIYVSDIIQPLFETVQTLLQRPDGIFVMAYAKRRVPVSIEYVLDHALNAGFTYELCAFANDDNETNSTTVATTSDEASGAGIFVYVFRWKQES